MASVKQPAHFSTADLREILTALKGMRDEMHRHATDLALMQDRMKSIKEDTESLNRAWRGEGTSIQSRLISLEKDYQQMVTQHQTDLARILASEDRVDRLELERSKLYGIVITLSVLGGFGLQLLFRLWRP